MIYDNFYAVNLAVDNKTKQVEGLHHCTWFWFDDDDFEQDSDYDFDFDFNVDDFDLMMMILNKIPIMMIEKTNQKVWGLHRCSLLFARPSTLLLPSEQTC